MTSDFEKAVLQKLDTLIGAIGRMANKPQAQTVIPQMASGADLDGKFGNPTVKDPPKWDGESFTGCTMSQCSPEYLDSLAGFYEWQSGKDQEAGKLTSGGKPASDFKLRDAARARGWAKRNRDAGALGHDADEFPVKSKGRT